MKIKALATIIMRQYLEDSELFEVEIEHASFLWKSEREKEWLPYTGMGEKIGPKPGES